MLQGHVPGMPVHQLSAPCAVNGTFFGRYMYFKPEFRNEQVRFNFDRAAFSSDGKIFLMSRVATPRRNCSSERAALWGAGGGGVGLGVSFVNLCVGVWTTRTVKASSIADHF